MQRESWAARVRVFTAKTMREYRAYLHYMDTEDEHLRTAGAETLRQKRLVVDAYNKQHAADYNRSPAAFEQAHNDAQGSYHSAQTTVAEKRTAVTNTVNGKLASLESTKAAKEEQAAPMREMISSISDPLSWLFSIRRAHFSGEFSALHAEAKVDFQIEGTLLEKSFTRGPIEIDFTGGSNFAHKIGSVRKKNTHTHTYTN